MALGLAFWIVMLLVLVSGVFYFWPRAPERRWDFGASLLWWLLLALVGWQVFGPPLRG